VTSKKRIRIQEKFIDAVHENVQAIQEGPQKRKNWSIHDLKNIRPLNQTQEDVFHAFFNGYNLCLQGSAGTGKSYIVAYLAMVDILENRSGATKLIIVRSAVPTREVGHLPGTLEEKVAPYELPYKDIFHDLFGRVSTYEDMKKARKIEFMTTTNIRGLTWDDSIIFIDEGQNMSFHEINSVVTRLGKNSKIIFSGDYIQTDLRKRGDVSGIEEFSRVVDRMSDVFCTVRFTSNDVVRSQFVKDWIIACEECKVNW